MSGLYSKEDLVFIVARLRVHAGRRRDAGCELCGMSIELLNEDLLSSYPNGRPATLQKSGPHGCCLSQEEEESFAENYIDVAISGHIFNERAPIGWNGGGMMIRYPEDFSTTSLFIPFSKLTVKSPMWPCRSNNLDCAMFRK
jgi:hypothetical protein